MDGNTVAIYDAAVFSNFIPIKKKLLSFPLNNTVIVDFRHCNFIDHSVIEILHHIQDDFKEAGARKCDANNILTCEDFHCAFACSLHFPVY